MEILNYHTQTLVDVAYIAIKKDIAERSLVPGQKVIIRELSEKYGISETPIKQALNRLITEGLVEGIPRKGVKVRAIKWKDIEELLDIRLMIETYSISHIIDTFHSSGDMKQKLRNNITKHMGLIENGTTINDYFDNYNLDQEFHKLFVKCMKNTKMLEIYNSLGTHTYAYHVYGKQEKQEMIAGVKEHEVMYNALLSKNEEELKNAIELHIFNAKAKLEKYVNNKL